MAISRVQGFTSLEETTNTSSGTTIARAFTSNVTAGNMIVAIVRNKEIGSGGTADAQSVTDGLSNTYTRVVGAFIDNAQPERVELYYAKNISGGACTVTATWAAAKERRTINVYEVSGCDTTEPLEASNSGTGTGTAISAGNVVTAGEAIIFAGMVNDDSYTGITAGTGWTGRDAADVWGEAFYEDRIEASGGTFTGDATNAASKAWAAVVAAFKVAGGGGGGEVFVPRRRTLLGVGI